MLPMIALWWPSNVSCAIRATSRSVLPRKFWQAACSMSGLLPWIFTWNIVDAIDKKKLNYWEVELYTDNKKQRGFFNGTWTDIFPIIARWWPSSVSCAIFLISLSGLPKKSWQAVANISSSWLWILTLFGIEHSSRFVLIIVFFYQVTVFVKIKNKRY